MGLGGAIRKRTALLTVLLGGLGFPASASANGPHGNTARAHRGCHAAHTHGRHSRACPRLRRRHAAAVPVVNASQGPLLSTAPIAPTAKQTSPPPPATPEGSTEGEVQVVEDTEVSEGVGAPERFPVCTAVLEAEMIACEVPDNYGS
jgi:hypothetical protein